MCDRHCHPSHIPDKASQFSRYSNSGIFEIVCIDARLLCQLIQYSESEERTSDVGEPVLNSPSQSHALVNTEHIGG